VRAAGARGRHWWLLTFLGFDGLHLEPDKLIGRETHAVAGPQSRARDQIDERRVLAWESRHDLLVLREVRQHQHPLLRLCPFVTKEMVTAGVHRAHFSARQRRTRLANFDQSL